MKTIIRKEYHIIETYTKVDVINDEQLNEIYEGDDRIIDTLIDNSERYAVIADEYDINDVPFEMPLSKKLGYIDFIFDEKDIDDFTADVPASSSIIDYNFYNNLENLKINNEEFIDSNKKTFMWDYSKIPLYDVKSYIRNNKINKII